MMVPVGTGVLVPEADDVPKLMDHDAKLVAVLPNRDGLGTATAFADEGAASEVQI